MYQDEDWSVTAHYGRHFQKLDYFSYFGQSGFFLWGGGGGTFIS